MKIKLKMTTDALLLAERIVSRCYNEANVLTQHQHLNRSIGFDVADKLEKRVKKHIKNSNLFDNTKTEITLKYHEAWALHNILIEEIIPDQNIYEKSLRQGLINQINQELQ